MTKLTSAKVKNKVKNDPRFKLVKHNKGYEYCSGFVQGPSGKLAYYSTGDYRTGSSIIIRTAQYPTDYTGGRNISSSLETMADDLAALVE